MILPLYGALSPLKLPTKAQDSLLDGLVSWWRLEEASGTREDAHGSNDLTDNNTVGSATGKVDIGASLLRANAEYLSRADPASLRFGNTDFTLALWVYPTLSFTGHGYMGKYNSAAPATEYVIYANPKPRFAVSANGSSFGDEVVGASDLTLDTWHFIVAWHDAAGNTINISPDGATPVSKAWASGVGTSSADFTLGRFYTGTDYMNGRLDECAAWSRVLTAAERARLYNAGAGMAYPG